MTDPTENIYLNALESLDYYDATIKEAFGKLVRPDGRLDNNNVEDLLSDISAIFGTDMSQAKAYFSEANESIAKYFDLDMISFQDFKEIFKMWLQSKSTKKHQPDPVTPVNANPIDNPIANSLSDIGEKQDENKGNQGKKVRISVEPKTPISSIGVLDSQRGENPERNFSAATGLRSQDLERLPPNYDNNKEKLDELLGRHSDEFYKKFEERKNGEEDTINLQDYFIFLQECFYLDEYLVMEKETDEKDFFGSVNSYKRLLKIAQSYFVKVKGVDPSEFNPVGQQLSFDDCFDILNYWFKTDDNVLITKEKAQPLPKSQVSDSNSNDVRKVLLETISKYTQMIEEATNEVEKQVLQTTIETMYKKLNELETGGVATAEGIARRESQMQRFKRREDKRMKSLKEIFDFYAKQQLHGGKPISFQNYERQFNTVNLGKFSVILKNFRIKVDQLRLKELFKKIASNHEDVTFEEFYKMLEKVAKSAELIKEVKVVKPNPEIRKEYKPDSYKTNPAYKSTNRSESRKRDGSEKPRNEYERIEDMWVHMGLYDGSFRNYLLTVQLAFNSPEKETFRINPEILNSKPKYRPIEVNSTLDLKERNELRKEVRDVKAKELNILHNYRAPASKSSAAKYEPPQKIENSYAALKLGKPAKAMPEKKMTLKQVGKFSYNEIGGVGGFNPYDLIEENDEEDNIYLAEYNLKPEKKTKSQKNLLEDFKPEDNKKLTPGKRQQAPPRNSRMFEYQNKLGGANSNSALSLHQGGHPKLTVIEDFDYRKIAESTPNPNMPGLGGKGMIISQSAKHIGLSSNPKPLYYNPQYDGNPRLYANITPVPQSYPIDVSLAPNSYKKAGKYAIDRANKVQQDSLKRGNELMNNIMNIQNTKLEQGLRVARK